MPSSLRFCERVEAALVLAAAVPPDNDVAGPAKVDAREAGSGHLVLRPLRLVRRTGSGLRGFPVTTIRAARSVRWRSRAGRAAAGGPRCCAQARASSDAKSSPARWRTALRPGACPHRPAFAWRCARGVGRLSGRAHVAEPCVPFCDTNAGATKPGTRPGLGLVVVHGHRSVGAGRREKHIARTDAVAVATAQFEVALDLVDQELRLRDSSGCRRPSSSPRQTPPRAARRHPRSWHTEVLIAAAHEELGEDDRLIPRDHRRVSSAAPEFVKQRGNVINGQDRSAVVEDPPASLAIRAPVTTGLDLHCTVRVEHLALNPPAQRRRQDLARPRPDFLARAVLTHCLTQVQDGLRSLEISQEPRAAMHPYRLGCGSRGPWPESHSAKCLPARSWRSASAPVVRSRVRRLTSALDCAT